MLTNGPELWLVSHAGHIHSNASVPVASPANASCSFGDAAEANDEGRHTRPLKAALGSRVAAAGQATKGAMERKDQKKDKVAQ